MDSIQTYLTSMGVEPEWADDLAMVIMIVMITLLSILANLITKKVVVRVITGVLSKNRFKWDDIIVRRKVFQRLSHIVPAIIIYHFADMFSEYKLIIEKGVAIYFIIVGMLVVDAFLNACNDIYRTFEISKEKPIRGYIQVIKIFMYLIGGIIIVANLIGQNPIILLGGLGALSAVLMLIFKDSILGLVAGIQLSTNDMVRVGDWIEMPKYNADGDVIDISLNTVKVMNWDKTITTIPSYALISDSFRNWRGMQASGGRRIKRSIYLDTSSIHFCTEEMLEKFKSIQLLKEYIESKQQEIIEYNNVNNIDTSNIVNGRKLTNIGIFRIYIQNYLKHHPRIHQDMTMMVRQLAPGETGLPLEIYAFTNDTRWVMYEAAQSDIFDHIFAVAPEFGLRVFQNPTGHDMKSLLRANI